MAVGCLPVGPHFDQIACVRPGMHNLVERVRQSAVWVSTQARHVSLEMKAVAAATKAFTQDELRELTSPKAFDADLHFVDGGTLTLQYLLAVDTINFCFWPSPGLEYEHLARGLKEALSQNRHVLDAVELARMTGSRLQTLLSLAAPMPLQDQRARLLAEVGEALMKGYGGSMERLVTEARGSAVALVDLIVTTFPGFQDRAMYRGQEVWMLKRAQILVGDIWGAFQGQGLGHFHDISALTMFADYRVPVVLRQMGILRYSQQLADKVCARQELTSGSEEEVEIRCCSIAAVEALRSALWQRAEEEGLAGPHALQLDWFLWERGERERATAPPHHRTLTTFY